MMSAPPPGDPATLQDLATKRKEDVTGMHSYFSSNDRSIPPLVDIPQDLVSMVLHSGATPQGGWLCSAEGSALLMATWGGCQAVGHMCGALLGMHITALCILSL
jgi:hypothetical protein